MTMPTERVSTRSSVNNMADGLATGSTDNKSSKLPDQMDQIDQSAHDINTRKNDGPSSTAHITLPSDEVISTVQDPPKYTAQDDRCYIDQALEKINKTLSDLALSFQEVKSTSNEIKTSNNEIKTSNKEIKNNFEKLRTGISDDLTVHKTAYDEKLDSIKESYDKKLDALEGTLIENSDIKYYEVVESVSDLKLQVNTDLQALKEQSQKDQRDIIVLQETIKEYLSRIQALEKNPAETRENRDVCKDIRMDELEKLLKNHILLTNNKFTRVQEAVDEVRIIANNVEAHGRRWAVRILGLPAPQNNIERTHEAKDLVIRFLNEHLNIHDVTTDDIDCAHRVGAVKNHKQTMLTRFFRRDIADRIIKTKRILKGKDLVLHEDTTGLNRKLINDLNKRAEVESCWYIGGTIWAKKTNSTRKFKVSINDNINHILRSDTTPDFPADTRTKTATKTATPDSNPTTAASSSTTTGPTDVRYKRTATSTTMTTAPPTTTVTTATSTPSSISKTIPPSPASRISSIVCTSASYIPSFDCEF
jgi:hypothetical protein